MSVIGQHGQCFSELCGLCGVSGSPSTVVRMLQYYSSWAQLRDTLISGWNPLGEITGAGVIFIRLHHLHIKLVCSVPGVVAVVVSDDCDFNSLLLKVIPALAMGNTHAQIITYFVSLIRLKPYLIITLHFQVYRV